jgi:hypothetical protein
MKEKITLFIKTMKYIEDWDAIIINGFALNIAKKLGLRIAQIK